MPAAGRAMRTTGTSVTEEDGTQHGERAGTHPGPRHLGLGSSNSHRYWLSPKMRAGRLAEPEGGGGQGRPPPPGWWVQPWARLGCVGGEWGLTSCAFLFLPESVPLLSSRLHAARAGLCPAESVCA